MKPKKPAVTRAAIAVVGAAVILGTAFIATRPSPSEGVRTTTPGASTTASAAPATTATPEPSGSGELIAPISDGTVSDLRRQGTLLEVLADGDAGSSISLDTARSVAAKQFAFVGKSPVVEASQARITVTDYGPEEKAEGRDTGKVTPLIQDRLAWGLVFDDVSVPVFGPITDEPGPSSYQTQFFVIVDAVTGEFLSAESF